jgi:putative heme transporter
MSDAAPRRSEADADVPAVPAPTSDPTPSARNLDIAPGRTLAVVDWVSYLHLVIGLLALLAIWGLAGSATDSITKIVIAGVLTLALDIPVRRLQNLGWARWLAASVVCLVLAAAVVAVMALLGPPAVREAARFGDELPATLEEFYAFPVIGERLERADIAARSDEWLEELPGTITADTVSEAVNRLISAITSVVQVLLLTLAMLLDGERLVRGVRSLVPRHRRATVDRAGRLVSDTLGRYFAGSLFLALLSGTYTLTVGLILGVPLVLLAAIWVAITDLIPQIGGFLGGSVFVVLALTQGAVTGALALGLFVAYMSTENYLIQPAVVGRSVNLSPPTTMIAAIIGGTAAGVPGALVATPFVGSVKAIYMAARYDDPEAAASGDRERERGA